MATISDVARRAGVSKSTASRVLSDAPAAIRVSSATRERIRSAASELGYRGNPFARAIRASRTKLLGVVSISLVHPFWLSVIEGIEEVARDRGFYLLLSEAQPDKSRDGMPDLLSTRGINAILLLGEVPVDDAWFDEAAAQGKCVVSIAWRTNRPDVPAVVLNNDASIDLALSHLCSLGHRRIAMISSTRTWEGQRRIAAFRRFYASLGLPEPAGFLRPAVDDGRPGALAQMLTDGANALDDLLARGEMPTALITGSSVRATGLIGHAHRRGLRVPDALSVVAFGDTPLYEHTIPPLTAIDERIAEQGRLAAQLVLDMTESALPAPSDGRVLEPRLIVGGSTGPAPGTG